MLTPGYPSRQRPVILQKARAVSNLSAKALEKLRKKARREERRIRRWLDQEKIEIDADHYLDLHASVSESTMVNLLNVALRSNAVVDAVRKANIALSENLNMDDLSIESPEIVRFTTLAARFEMMRVVLENISIPEHHRAQMLSRYVERLIPTSQFAARKSPDPFAQVQEQLNRLGLNK